MDEWGAAAIGGAIVGVIGAIGVLLERIYRARGKFQQTTTKTQDESAAAEQKRESSMIREYKALVNSLREERQEDREMIHELRNDIQKIGTELAVCRAGRARADERIAALEEALQEAGIPHRKWNPEESQLEGSHEHKPYPKTSRPLRPNSQIEEGSE